MKQILTIAILTGLVSTTHGREPIFAPGVSVPVVYQGDEYSPTPADQTVPMPAPQLQPIPAAPSYAAPLPHVSEYSQLDPGVIVCDACAVPPVPLFHKVKVRRHWNIARCAGKKIVSVPDPCNTCNCVFIEICVPPCACEHVSYNRRGNSVTFDYGKYSVDVTARRGMLFVVYKD